MTLLVSDSGYPGFAFLDFKRDMGAGDLLISLRSVQLKPGEYLSPGGKWSKTSHLFKAVRVGRGVYRVGPEIVNQLELAYDTIEVGVGSLNTNEVVIWPELTPSADPDPLPPPLESSGEPDEEKAREEEKENKRREEEEAKKEEERKKEADKRRREREEIKGGDDSANSGDQDKRTPVWLKFGLPIAGILALGALSSWLFCTPFQWCGASQNLFDSALSCAKSKAACQAGQCFDGFLAVAPQGEERTRAERLRQSYDQQCRAGFENAKACAERSRQSDPCAAKQCFDDFLAQGQSSSETRSQAEALAADLQQRCAAEKEAAANARTCIDEGRRPPCRSLDGCVRSYAAAFPNGPHRDELLQRAQATATECINEVAGRIDRDNRDKRQRDDEAFAIAKACADRVAECEKRTACFDLYRTGFPDGAHAAEVESALNRACRHVVADGVYRGMFRAEESCSARATMLPITIKDGKICWEHPLSFTNKWQGAVDSGGAINARVIGRNGTLATGEVRNGGGNLELTYPECRNPIKVQINGIYPGEPSPCR